MDDTEPAVGCVHMNIIKVRVKWIQFVFCSILVTCWLSKWLIVHCACSGCEGPEQMYNVLSTIVLVIAFLTKRILGGGAINITHFRADTEIFARDGEKH